MTGPRISKRDAFEKMLKIIEREFPEIPEAKCCCAVVCQALWDIFYPGNAGAERSDLERITRIAEDYLSGEMPHAAIWGVEADWIRHLIFSMRSRYDSC